jgi:hypothetical protein
VGLSLASQLTETVDIFLQAGPSFIRSDEDDFGAITTTLYAIDTASQFAQAIDIPSSGASVCDFQGTDFLFKCLSVNYVKPPGTPNTTHLLAPPPNASGLNDTDISFFAEAKLTKRWQKTLLQITYTRSESASNGVASSSIVDSANVFFSLQLDRPWYFVVFGQWIQQQVVSDVRQSLITVKAGPPLTPASLLFFAEANGQEIVVTQSANGSDLTQWGASFRVERRLTKQLTLLGRFSYFHQKQEGANSSVETDGYVGFVGLRYAFDPVIF